MKLEQQVVSLALAKRLKELGVKQESIFYHYHFKNTDGRWIVKSGEETSEFAKSEGLAYAAFTVAELGEMLADGMIDSHKTAYGYWTCKYEYVADEAKPEAESRGPTEAEARGLMLAYLIEKGLPRVGK